MRSASLSNGKLAKDFIRVQENSNEDELAGPKERLPDISEPSEQRVAGAGAVAGNSRSAGDGGGDFQRRGDAGIQAG
jgi:hypothetical protein